MSAYHELKAFLVSSTAITAQSYAFFDYVIEKTTSAQYREILKITNTVNLYKVLQILPMCCIIWRVLTVAMRCHTTMDDRD